VSQTPPRTPARRACAPVGAADKVARMSRRIRTLAATVACLAFAAGGCGGAGSARSSGAGDAGGPLVVAAASSLQTAFTDYGRRFGGGAVRFSFAGSDELAAQIRQGVTPDVLAAANTQLPAALHAAGLVGAPVVFAGNRLVLAVPRASRIASLRDVERAGTTLAIGSATVPIGSYARGVLARLPAPARRAILANVRSQEPDVKGIVGKLTQGAVDAGFVYATDVDAAGGALRAIALPAALKPTAAYGVAVVAHAPHPAAARRFVAGLLHGDGQRALRAAGFLPPPGPASP
jgi:molybdate transport system substrate-binding protein